MMVTLKVKEGRGYTGKAMYLNPLHVTAIKENDKETCCLRVIGIEEWLKVYEPADMVACKVSDALEEML